MITRTKDTLLLVGSAGSDRIQLRGIFGESFNLLEAESVSQALVLLARNHTCIAAVLADIPIEEIRPLADICSRGNEDDIPLVCIITSIGTGIMEERAFLQGATDVVIRPYTPTGIQRRVQVLIDVFLHRWQLEKLVSEQETAIRNSNQVMLDALSAIIEHRSAESGNHVMRIRGLVRILLEAVRDSCPEYGLNDRTISLISSASALHDIGKISIPDSILNKPGRLTAEEFGVMKTHSQVGADFIKTLSGSGDPDFLRYAYNITLYHHERWDGKGYPYGLEGDNIPICAQVVGLADAFDALTNPRVYKEAYPYKHSVNMILNGECGSFSPKLLNCFKQMRNQLSELARRYEDGLSPKDDSVTAPLPAPAMRRHKLDSLQLSQVKYQSMLHYSGDTVIEINFDDGVYHVVYNPDPDFHALSGSSHSPVLDLSLNHVHPEDRPAVEELQKFIRTDFFTQDVRRKTCRYRAYNPISDSYQSYKFTLLRLNSDDSGQRMAIAIWHKLSEGENQPMPADTPFASPALSDLTGAVLRCRGDLPQTIDFGRGLYTLLGCSETELQDMCRGSYMELVHPDDRAAIRAGFDQLMARGGKREDEYRILKKDGSWLWVSDKNRVYTDSDGQIYHYHVINDNSRDRELRRQLEDSALRNQLIIEQTGDIVFDWDLVADNMYLSPEWEQRFGYKGVTENYSQGLGVTTHFHPDDTILVRQLINALSQGTAHSYIDVRIADSSNKYLWSRLKSTAVKGEDGKVARIVGVIEDIHELKQTELNLKEKADRDALTRLLNKDSTRTLVSEHLMGSDNLSAMLILDLDNFKAVNDTYGHLYGDAILSQIGTTLKKLFRSNDIIGRIGGDEFLVFMTDIPSETLVRDRCALLLDTFRKELGHMMPELSTSFSIGAALSPAHGSSYTELFRKADEALYAAKNEGKNRFKLYDPAVVLSQKPDSAGRDSTAIDSDELPGMANSSFVRFVFRHLYESTDIENALNVLLAYVGEQLNVSRVYIFENNEDNTACSNTFEWCNMGIEPQIENLQNVSYITDIPGWPEVFDENGMLYCSDISLLEENVREILEPQGIKSLLICSILDRGVFRGYVGFDDCTTGRLWTQEQIEMLKFLSEVISMFLLKARAQSNALAQTENLRAVLDNQDAWVYVIDPESCRLKFVNRLARSAASGIPENATCHRTFMESASRCENCPCAELDEGESQQRELYSPILGKTIRSTAKSIMWNGEKSCLITCTQLD